MSSEISLTSSKLESRRLREFLKQIVSGGITEECSFYYNGSKFGVRLCGRGVFCPKQDCIDQQLIDAINHKVASLASLVQEINEFRSSYPTIKETCLSSSNLLVDEINELILFRVSYEKINQMLHLVSPVVVAICPWWFLYVYFERRMH